MIPSYNLYPNKIFHVKCYILNNVCMCTMISMQTLKKKVSTSKSKQSWQMKGPKSKSKFIKVQKCKFEFTLVLQTFH